MAKVLLITKADKTTHIAPLSNKPALLSYNNRLKADQKMKIEEVEEAEAKNRPYIDPSHVTAGEALEKAGKLTQELNEKDKRIAELEALLAKNGGGAPAPVVPMKAADKIALIAAATSVDQVNELVGDDTRATAMAAADKRIAELEA